MPNSEQAAPALQVERPLPAGTVIEYCGEQATVIEDFGSTLTVKCDGRETKWRWTFEGVSCTVVSMPAPALPVERPLPPGTIIEFCGDQATVVRDHGDSLIVDCGPDGVMKWYWTFEGVSCTVVSLPQAQS